MTRRPVVPWVHYLRGIGALLVVLHHVAGRLQLPGDGVSRWFPAGSSGVDLFFVLSGFVMRHMMQGRYAAPGASWQFLRERLARVLPPYWIVSLLAVGGRAAAGLATTPGLVVVSLLLVPSANVYVVANGWSLSYEIVFYALLSVSLLFQRRTAKRLVVAVLVAAVVCGRFFPLVGVLAVFATDSLFLEFLFGMLVHRLYASGITLPRAAWLPLLIVAIGAWWGTAADGWLLERCVSWGLPAAGVLAALVLGNPEVRLAKPLLAALGDASYSLYLVHAGVLGAFSWLLRDWRPAGATVLLAGVLMVLVSVGTALLFHRVVEVPLVQWSRRAVGTPPTDAFGSRFRGEAAPTA